jgi:hypothetical protein
MPSADETDRVMVAQYSLSLGMANYYIFLSNEADILREMRAFIQALK